MSFKQAYMQIERKVFLSASRFILLYVTSKFKKSIHQVTKNKKTNKDKLLNVIFGLIFMLSPFYGIALTIWAVGDIENYISPYIFSFVFGCVGVILSYIVSARLKSVVLRVNKKIKDYSQLRFFFAMGFIGIFLLIGVKLNSFNASMQNTYETKITKKTEREYRFMLAGFNKLHFIINNQYVEIRCHRDLWENKSLGQKVNLEYYNGKIGFDYWKINDK